MRHFFLSDYEDRVRARAFCFGDEGSGGGGGNEMGGGEPGTSSSPDGYGSVGGQTSAWGGGPGGYGTEMGGGEPGTSSGTGYDGGYGSVGGQTAGWGGGSDYSGGGTDWTGGLSSFENSYAAAPTQSAPSASPSGVDWTGMAQDYSGMMGNYTGGIAGQYGGLGPGMDSWSGSNMGYGVSGFDNSGPFGGASLGQQGFTGIDSNDYTGGIGPGWANSGNTTQGFTTDAGMQGQYTDTYESPSAFGIGGWAGPGSMAGISEAPSNVGWGGQTDQSSVQGTPDWASSPNTYAGLGGLGTDPETNSSWGNPGMYGPDIASQLGQQQGQQQTATQDPAMGVPDNPLGTNMGPTALGPQTAQMGPISNAPTHNAWAPSYPSVPSLPSASQFDPFGMFSQPTNPVAQAPTAISANPQSNAQQQGLGLYGNLTNAALQGMPAGVVNGPYGLPDVAPTAQTPALAAPAQQNAPTSMTQDQFNGLQQTALGPSFDVNDPFAGMSPQGVAMGPTAQNTAQSFGGMPSAPASTAAQQGGFGNATNNDMFNGVGIADQQQDTIGLTGGQPTGNDLFGGPTDYGAPSVGAQQTSSPDENTEDEFGGPSAFTAPDVDVSGIADQYGGQAPAASPGLGVPESTTDLPAPAEPAPTPGTATEFAQGSPAQSATGAGMTGGEGESFWPPTGVAAGGPNQFNQSFNQPLSPGGGAPVPGEVGGGGPATDPQSGGGTVTGGGVNAPQYVTHRPSDLAANAGIDPNTFNMLQRLYMEQDARSQKAIMDFARGLGFMAA